MGGSKSAYRGCLLGLAVGDALGYPVDKKSWAQIREDYGPNGLMGFDLSEDGPQVTSHTQLCAFTCNGLLLGQTRSQVSGRGAPYARYIALSQKEWANAQRRYSTLQRTYCWVYWVDQFRRRRCADNRITDTLAMDHIGTLEEPINRLDGPGSLSSAVAVGMFEAGTPWLGAEAVALTCGHSTAFISGAMVAELVRAALRDRETPLEPLIRQTVDQVEAALSPQYPKTRAVAEAVRYAMDLAAERRGAMELLVCQTAPQVLAGAVYALLSCGGDFDAAMITAVNHSGRSSAVAALVGAVLGARLGEEGLPEFYVECLEEVEPLVTLADDMASGCPQRMSLDWDRKYLQGER